MYDLFHFNFPTINIPNDEYHLLGQCYTIEEKAKEITEAFAEDTLFFDRSVLVIFKALECMQACETLLNWFAEYDDAYLDVIDLVHQDVVAVTINGGK